MRAQLFIRKTHKWVGLVLGIQILFWFISGFLMSFMPIDEVRGDHLLKPTTQAAVRLEQLDLSILSQQIKQPINSIQVKPWLGQTVVEVKTNEQVMLFDTPDLKQISPISKNQVRQVIATNLAPKLSIESITRLTEAPSEVRGKLAPLWQVQLSGSEHARIYVSERNGDIVAKRTDRWRLFDFMWMLHIMDYDERSDFNHPLLYLTALAALLFTLTGFVLLFFGLKRRKKPSNT